MHEAELDWAVKAGEGPELSVRVSRDYFFNVACAISIKVPGDS